MDNYRVRLKYKTYSNSAALKTVIYLNVIFGFARCIIVDINELKKHQLECMDEANTKADDILAIKSGNWQIDRPAVKKWGLCLLVRAGLMSDQGVFRTDHALLDVPETEKKKILENIDQCLYKKKYEPHDIAWNYLQCINTKPGNKGFTIL